MKVGIIIGTRPEIIKMAPIIKECEKRKIEFFIIHSNQHYSENMDKVFFEELSLPQPLYNLAVGSGKHSNMTGNILIKIEPILESENPDVILVQGDTNTVLAGALAASKLGIKVGHIEAGLRSYDRTMPEETNRIVTDHVSDYLFAVSKRQEEILLSEGIDKKKVHKVGNTVIDTLYSVLDKVESNSKNYALITIHRASNVDRKETFEEVAKALNDIAQKFSFDLIWPIHPRAKKYLKMYSIELDEKIKLIEPLGYKDFINLQAGARFILTDSGGLQEEACALKVPCITLRENTERPESVDVGANILVGRDKDKIISAINHFENFETHNWEQPFGIGDTSTRILNILEKDFGSCSSEFDQKIISVIGLGYMGLPMASLLASAGHKVNGIDISLEKVKSINLGECPFEEKGMKALVKSAINSKRMIASTEYKKSDVFILSLPTNNKNNACDVSILESVCEKLVNVVEDNNLVIVESTIAPGTMEKIIAPIINKSEKSVKYAYCPERAIPGNTIFELVNNDRVVGGLCEESTNRAYDLYKTFVKGEVFKAHASVAECVKLVENSFRDTNIAFANEIDEVLSDLNVDSKEVIKLANKHPRVNILNPGPGVGGHCIAIDPWFLVQDTNSGDFIRKAREVNDSRPFYHVDKIKEKYKNIKNIGILGVAYKPNVDDARETPALDIVERLKSDGYNILISDPYVKNWKYELIDQGELIEKSELIIIVTNHNDYKNLDLNKKIYYCN